ncbi:MAG: FlgD immunoglobulin-like domain containing protein [Candidatus Eisenbacteria bacterium]
MASRISPRLPAARCLVSAVRCLAVIALLLAGPILCRASAADQPVTRDDAVAIATASLPGGSLAGVRLFVDPDPLAAGTRVATWKKEVFVAADAGWFVFVDLKPAANWEHPCLYLFVNSQTGALDTFEAMVPPRDQTRLREVTNGRDNPPAGLSERLLERFDELVAQLEKPAAPTRGLAYALIISGGADPSNNHIRYWNDSAFIYRALVNYYGYADENIYVCISDGLNPAVDRSNGTNSPSDLDGDGDADIQYPATLTYIDQVFDALATQLTASDQLFIFTTDHGGQESGWDCYLNLWNWEELRDDQLAAYVDALPCEAIICTFEQCFSGGMIDDLQGDGRVIATGANYDEYSWAMGPDYVYDTFVYHWTCAVGWADPNGNPVDADTNDDGIVSMHEAFLYAEAHDFDDETPQYSSNPAELGDMLNLFGNLEGVYLACEDMLVDDDMVGVSRGDGDAVVDFQETIELYVTLHNMGTENAVQVTGLLESTSSYVGMMVGEVGFGDIPAGSSVTNPAPLVFHVAHDVPDGADLGLTLTLSEEPGAFTLDLLATAPAYDAALLEVDDSAGNGNGIADPGETVTLSFRIRNVGGCPTPALDAVLGSADSYFSPDETEHPIGVILVSGEAIEGGFTVTIDPACPPVYAGGLFLHYYGPDQYHRMSYLPLPVGRIFADDLESGTEHWTHYVGPGSGWVDEWHAETYRNHTPGGGTSWKCGGAGAANYANYAYGLLETEAFDLPPGSSLTFWHRMNAETSPSFPGYCYDGGLLQISIDGGAWQTLTPVGGYPYIIRTGGTQTGPFAAGTLVWSGAFDWSEATFDLASFSGAAKLRWVFGSDQGVVLEGWYVDDVLVTYSSPMGLVAGEITPSIARVRLLPALPNPAVMDGAGGLAAASAALAHLRFQLPSAQEVRLDLFDLAGRRVRTLAQGTYAPGLHEIPWDGRDAAGQPVGAGSYYYRLLVEGETHAGKVMVVR